MNEKMIFRKCQGCGRVKERVELIKITKLKDGMLKISPGSKELGRSVYVCCDKNCINNLIKKRRIKTALKFQNQEEIKRIEKELLNLV